MDFKFKTKPFKHQLDIFKKTCDKKLYALFLEMGLGKSKIIIDTAAYLWGRNEISALIIVAPKGVYKNWVNKEIPEHMPGLVNYDCMLWQSSPTRKQKKDLCDFALKKTEGLKILVVNVEGFSTNICPTYVTNFIKYNKECMLVVDESTSIKNHKAKRTKALVKVGALCKYKRILTGTPITKWPLDLYAQMGFLNPDILGFKSFFTFRNHYAEMVDITLANGRKIPKITGFKNIEDLKQRIKDFSVRLEKSECLDLPEKIYLTRAVELNKKQQEAYDVMQKENMVLFNSGDMASAMMVITQMLKLHQITCGFIIDDRGVPHDLGDSNPRLEELLNILEEVERPVIWANYTHNIRQIKRALEKIYGKNKVVTYYGETSNEDRDLALKKFADGTADYFIGSQNTAGYGLTLTSTSNVIYYSNSYNLEQRLQSEDRIHRIGQKNNVTYVDLVASGTVDEHIIKALINKKNVADEILDNKWRKWLTGCAY